MKKQTSIVIAVLLAAFVACKKDNNNPDNGKEEGKAIENAMLGSKYVIVTITDQTGADARSQFHACNFDDTHFIRTAGTDQIIQGADKCGTHAQDTVNASWGLGYSNESLTALFFSLYISGNTYTEIEFKKPNFSVNTNTGEITLKYISGSNTYTIKLHKQ